MNRLQSLQPQIIQRAVAAGLFQLGDFEVSLLVQGQVLVVTGRATARDRGLEARMVEPDIPVRVPLFDQGRAGQFGGPVQAVPGDEIGTGHGEEGEIKQRSALSGGQGPARNRMNPSMPSPSSVAISRLTTVNDRVAVLTKITIKNTMMRQLAHPGVACGRGLRGRFSGNSGLRRRRKGRSEPLRRRSPAPTRSRHAASPVRSVWRRERPCRRPDTRPLGGSWRWPRRR